MSKPQLQRGYSMVEVLVAVAVLLIAIVGPMTIASQGIKSSSFALEQNTAFFLAQEGIEAIHYLKGWYAVQDIADGLGVSDPDTSWGWVVESGSDSVLRVPNGPCNTAFNTNGDTCTFGIDWRDSSLEDNFTGRCAGSGGDINRCNLYLDESYPRAKYSHQSGGGTLSPYNRAITVTRRSAYVIEVTSVVTWESTVFPGQTQKVQLRTMLYDSNFEQ